MTSSTRPLRGQTAAWSRRWVPPQHGAWAMLLLPFLAGVVAFGWSWPLAPLLVALTAGYALSYYGLLAVKTRRPARVRPQLLGYGLAAGVAAAVLVTARPRVLLAAPVFAVLLAVNAWFASRRHDHDLVNAFASVALACAVLPVVAVVQSRPWADVVTPLVLVTAVLVGSVLFVRTMIRERGEHSFLVASVGYHALLTLAAVVLVGRVGWGPALLFAGLTARAVVLPRRSLPPARVGALEGVAYLATLMTVALLP